MAQVLSKEYKCLTCHKPIKISKIDNAGPNARKKWEKFERDGTTPHQCGSNSNNSNSNANNYNPNKKYHYQSRDEQTEEEVSSTQTVTVDNCPSEQIAALAEEVRGFRETINNLTSQIQMLRSDVKSKIAINKEQI
jgi:hypothetical protein